MSLVTGTRMTRIEQMITNRINRYKMLFSFLLSKGWGSSIKEKMASNNFYRSSTRSGMAKIYMSELQNRERVYKF